MKTLVLCALALSLSFVATAAFATDPAAFDAKIEAELRAIDDDAATIFRRANEARARGDFEAAANLYAQVRAKAPAFVHATRRLCSVESARGRRSEAVALCRSALAADDSPENRSALACALAAGSPSSVEAREAVAHAENAVKRRPDDAIAAQSLCVAALAADDVPALRRCSGSLDKLAPNDAATDYYGAILAADAGDEYLAHLRIDRAVARGLPTDARDRFLEAMDASRPWYAYPVRVGVRVVLAWLGGFVLLLAAGFALSRATLASAARIPSEPGGRARGSELALRRVYRAVLLASCAYYYASLPLLAVMLVAIGGGLIVAIFWVGHVPIKIVLIIGVVVLWSLWAIARSIFVRARDEAPGEPLDLAKEQKLDAMLGEVAARIGTRKVDRVYLTPGTDMAVTERGGLLKQLRRRSERALILGAAVLDGMTVRELKAILAHEYGHFHNEDTAGGGFALAVRRSILTMALSLIQSGIATVYNPAWWFVRGFYAVFLRVSQGASRLQEILADRWAVAAYGSAAFASGLRHVVARSVEFDAHADATLNEVVAQKRALANLYSYEPSAKPDAGAIREQIDAAIARAASPYDSHPRPADRIAWAERAALAGADACAGDDDAAWSLFVDRGAVEHRMTEAVRAQILRTQNIAIPRAEARA
jgi:Zn-dependent protease with chaperone function